MAFNPNQMKTIFAASVKKGYQFQQTLTLHDTSPAQNKAQEFSRKLLLEQKHSSKFYRGGKGK